MWEEGVGPDYPENRTTEGKTCSIGNMQKIITEI